MPPVVAAAAIGLGGTIYATQQRKKSEKRAREAAERAESKAREEARRVEEATALTPEEQTREERAFGLEKRRLPILEERAGMPGEELIRGTGPIAQTALDQILSGVRQPEELFESTLEPELELVRQMVNQEAVKRGVFSGLPEGGIRFEQLGRAGVELAIKSARERRAARQEALSNAAAVISESLGQEKTARGELSGFLKDIQNLSARGRERSAQGVLRGSQDVQQAIRGTGETAAEIAGFGAGRAAEAEGALGRGIADIGGRIYEDITRPKTPAFTEEATKRTSVDRLLELSGGTDFRKPEYVSLRQ